MLTLDDVRAVHERVEAVAQQTPLEYSHAFSEMTDAKMYLELKNSQHTGSFKIRGTTSRITTLPGEERAISVVTVSVDNRAQGVILAVSRVDVNSRIIVPEYAPISKVKATERYDGDVVLYGSDCDEVQTRAYRIKESEGRAYIHTLDDEYVMARQGVIGLEIAEGRPDLDVVVVPVGGGGLISGISVTIKEQYPDAHVIGMQTEQTSGAANSLSKGLIQTIDEMDTTADGITARRIGDELFEVIRERVDEIVTVSDEGTAVALTYLLERPKALVGGAGAIVLVAFIFQKFDYEENETIVPVLCGDNIDMDTLVTAVVRGLVEAGRYLKIRIELKDHPGSLKQSIKIIVTKKASICAVRRDRASRRIASDMTEVEIDLEMRDPDHVESLLGELRGAGYDVGVLD